MYEVIMKILNEIPIYLALVFLGVITGTVTAFTSHFRFMQDQNSHQTELLGQILAQLEELNRNDRV